MTDPFSMAIGIAGLVSLAFEILKTSYTYTSGVRKAPKAIAGLMRELLALRSILSDGGQRDTKPRRGEKFPVSKLIDS